MVLLLSKMRVVIQMSANPVFVPNAVRINAVHRPVHHVPATTLALGEASPGAFSCRIPFLKSICYFNIQRDRMSRI